MAERHIYDDVEYVEGAGSVVKIKGTGTQDEEVPVINTGYGATLEKGADAEVLVIGGSSDTNLKMAFVQIPAGKQRKWPQGRSGIQNAADATHALEFSDGKLTLTKGTFQVGEGGTIEVRDGQIYIRGNATITGALTVNGGVIASSYDVGTNPDVPAATS